MLRSQKGNAIFEYVIATAVVVALVFGAKIGDKSLWDMFHDAFQQRHTNYTKSISNLDNVDATSGKDGNEKAK